MELHEVPPRSFLILLTCMVAMILVPPYLGDFPHADLLYKLLFHGLLLVSLYFVGEQKTILVIGLLVSIPLVMLEFPTGGATGGYPLLWLELAFLAYIGYHVFMRVVRAREVTLSVIYCAMCCYLVLGLFWAVVYNTLDLFYDGAFTYTGTAVVGQSSLSNFLYYSFVTLTTLGYGDMAPVHPVAKAWSVSEAVAGQFYLTVVLARLVGLYIARGASRSD